MVSPTQPTQKMIEEHEVSHLPFRSWCPACVRGRQKSNPHRKQSDEDRDAEQIPVISYDYGFLGGDDASVSSLAHSMPVLVGHDRRSKADWTHPVPSKGTADPYPAKAVAKDLEMTGYKRVILKSDQEPSIVAVLREAANLWKGEVVPEGSPKGESKSNGEVERAVQNMQGLARTLKEAIEIKTKCEIPSRHPVLAWLVE